MTKAEFAFCLRVFKSFFPNTKTPTTDEEFAFEIENWHRKFKNYDKNDLVAAMDKLVDENRKFVTWADVLETIRGIQNHETLALIPQESFARVCGIVKNTKPLGLCFHNERGEWITQTVEEQLRERLPNDLEFQTVMAMGHNRFRGVEDVWSIEKAYVELIQVYKQRKLMGEFTLEHLIEPPKPNALYTAALNSNVDTFEVRGKMIGMGFVTADKVRQYNEEKARRESGFH